MNLHRPSLSTPDCSKQSDLLIYGSLSTMAVITCFSYVGNDHYVFNPKHVCADLRRILRFVLKVTKTSLTQIYILTDLVPPPDRALILISRLELMLEQTLRRIGYHSRIPPFLPDTQTVIEWIQDLSINVAMDINMSPSKLYRELVRMVRRVLWSGHLTDTLIWASLLTNFHLVNGSLDYDKQVRSIFRQNERTYPNPNLFFYYTGHGVRYLSNREEIKDICLVIPSQQGLIEIYARADLQNLIRAWTGPSIVIFDCCRSECLLEFPLKISFNKFGRIMTRSSTRSFQDDRDIIYIGSTRHDQTCGFRLGPNQYGSLFTHYLMKFLSGLGRTRKGTSPEDRHFDRLHHSVDQKIQRYRSSSNNPPQNMLIQLNQEHLETFPSWLFGQDS